MIGIEIIIKAMVPKGKICIEHEDNYCENYSVAKLGFCRLFNVRLDFTDYGYPIKCGICQSGQETNHERD